MSHKYPDCYYCGGKVVEKKVEWDYRRKGRHFIFRDVPAGVCLQCGEKFFRPEISRQMDEAYQNGETKHLHVKIPVIHFRAA
jgi:YgiT-type zinc finger domain-containing protein